MALALPAPAGEAQAPQASGAHGLCRHVEYPAVADAVIETVISTPALSRVIVTLSRQEKHDKTRVMPDIDTMRDAQPGCAHLEATSERSVLCT